MWSVIRLIVRTIPPLLMLGGGAAAFVYGVAYHTAPVSEEEEIEVSMGPSSPFAPPGQPPMEGPFGEPMFPGDAPPMDAMDAPPMDAPPVDVPPFMDEVKVTKKVIVTEEETEPTLIREVTFGGVRLLASGELMRTYSGDPPLLCPT